MKVLVVDADPGQLDNLTIGLRFGWPNWNVLTARDGEEGLRLFVEHSPRLVLVDAGAPRLHGLDLLREIRRLSQVPVIVLSTLRTELDHVRALDLGADDYIVKPVEMLTLLARIRAILRRTDPGAAGRNSRQEAIRAGDLRIDPVNQQVWVDDRNVTLTPSEFRLLDLLVRNTNRLVLNGTICEAVWGAGWNATRNDLKALVHRLRLKLGDNSRDPKYIENRRGIGYRFIGQRPDPYPG